jgi:glycosyltransferase involved in cell wall biosynthesis
MINSVLPKISVITVCFNSAGTIQRTLESVASQTYPNVEYIVVDGGSKDTTMEIVQKFRSAIHHVVSEADHGVYDAMNKGISLATGAWIHLLNSDDFYVDCNALQNAVPLLDPLRTNYFPIFRQLGDGSRDLQDWPYSRWRLFFSAFLPHPGLVVSREQYSAVGLYDLRYRIAADHDMVLRLTNRWPGLKHDVNLVVMQQGGLSEQNMRSSLYEFRDATVRNSLPWPLATLFMGVKRIWWRI